MERDSPGSPFEIYHSIERDIGDITEQGSTDGPTRSRSASTCTLGRDEGPCPIEIEDDEVIDLTIDDARFPHSAHNQGEISLPSCRVSEENIKPGDCVEVHAVPLGRYEIHFILVKVIARTEAGDTIFRGIPFARNRGLSRKLPKKLNEVCQILHVDQAGLQEATGLIDVDVSSVIKKRTIITTNALWPKHSCDDFSSIGDSSERRRVNEAQGTLVCRWKFRIFSVTQGHTFKPVEQVLERINSTEVADSKYRESEEALCYQWRGGRVPGGAWSPADPGLTAVGTIVLDESQTQRQQRSKHRSRGQKYTVFDSFCGAGGVSRGAKMAGMEVTHAVDKAEGVWETYTANFPSTILFKGPVDEFIKSRRQHIRVDILHLSPPCQYFSPAHTHMSANDDENIFALFSCSSLINKVRPRIITVEQTFGITHERHQNYLHILINDFTQFGYSVRWKVVRLCTWGSAQDRKRLIMIAASPGEMLPPFPRPTHSEGGSGGLEPYMTIRKALRGIRPGDELHNLSEVKTHDPLKEPYDPDRLAGTITTAGTCLYYPDGSRELTLREHANLQGFPPYHQFRGTKTSIKRQIGNAFPPNTVKFLYKHLEKWLLLQDSMAPYQQSALETITVADGNEGNEQENMIVVDLDSSSVPIGRRARERVPEFSIQDDIWEDFGAMEVRDDASGNLTLDASCEGAMIDLT